MVTLSLRTLGAAAFLLVVASAFSAAPANTRFNDPLITPASMSPLATQSTMIGIAQAGSRLIGVGRNGLILMSDDAGQHWTQIASPVSTDFTAIKFSDAQHGWIVGHDAIVLRTTDGGLTWERKLDGRSALNIILKFYETRSKAGDNVAREIISDTKTSAGQSAAPDVFPYPLLDVWFTDSNEGFVVGAFGLILHTTDSGANWTPWIDRTDNDHMNHIYAVSGNAHGEVYLAGEQGFLRRLDRADQRFVKIPSPYIGSYFGLYVQKDLVVAYGLRGHAFLSMDEGHQWEAVATGLPDNIIAVFPDTGHKLLFVSQAGDMLSTNQAGGNVEILKVKHSNEIYGAIANGRGAVVTVGMSGVNVVHLSNSQLLAVVKSSQEKNK